MEDTEKYLIHATVTAEGVVERSDVVGAIFGQTEGLLGDELDLPELRRTGKVGRIDVSVSSASGESRGDVTIASSLDKVETATLAAALETIDRVGPCRATFAISEIEDVRAAKRRAVVDRATELIQTGFDDTVMSSAGILASVREHVRVADVTEYEGLPAGPRVADGDAIIVVEGRADVLTLLSYGIKNAVAVEGTNVPEPIAALTANRTVTAFLDADRGGELILEELRQVGDVDYVARPPSGQSVEDLDHHDVFTALQNKTPVGPAFDPSSDVTGSTDRAASDPPADSSEPAEQGESTGSPETIPATDGSATPALSPDNDGATLVDSASRTDTDASGGTTNRASTSEPGLDGQEIPVDGEVTDSGASTVDAGVADEVATSQSDATAAPSEPTIDERDRTDGAEPTEPTSLYGHVDAVIRSNSGQVRFVDETGSTVTDAPTAEVDDILDSLDTAASAMVFDGIVSQQLLDRAADHGISTIIADSLGQFVKRPANVRLLTADDVADTAP